MAAIRASTVRGVGFARRSYERKNERQQVCSRRECRAAFKLDKSHYLSFGGTSIHPLKTSIKSAFRKSKKPAPHNEASSSIHPLKQAAKSAVGTGTRALFLWKIIAGPELSPQSLHAATISDGPDGKWEGGFYQRTEAQNRAAVEAHFDELDRVENDHCALCLRTDDLGDRRRGKHWLVVCRGCEAERVPPPGLAGLVDCLIPADLSIPGFLRRAI